MSSHRPVSLKGIIFDVSDTVLDKSGRPVPGIATAIAKFRRSGVKVAMVANADERKTVKALLAAGLDFDLVVGRDTAGGLSKPSPVYCEIPAQRFDAKPHELIYVGDNDKTDAFCAVNAGVLYLAASWANDSPQYGLPVDDPNALLRFVYRFLMSPPRWYWVADRKDALRRHIHVRSLLPMTRSNYSLKKVLKEGGDLRVNGVDLWGFLSRRLLTALALDGLLSDVDTWAWYPAHQQGAPTKARYAAAFDLASRFYRDRHVTDLLMRHTTATKLATARAGGGTRPTFSSQVRTVQLNPQHKKRVIGKHVLVADDFSTEGLSFEWARNLLYAAGARDVTCIAFGRYWNDYRVFTPKQRVEIDPWRPSSLSDDDFDMRMIQGKIDDGAEAEMQRLIKLQPPGTTTAAQSMIRAVAEPQRSQARR